MIAHDDAQRNTVSAMRTDEIINLTAINTVRLLKVDPEDRTSFVMHRVNRLRQEKRHEGELTARNGGILVSSINTPLNWKTMIQDVNEALDVKLVKTVSPSHGKYTIMKWTIKTNVGGTIVDEETLFSLEGVRDYVKRKYPDHTDEQIHDSSGHITYTKPTRE